jgi:hypothetical protein
VAEQLDDGGTIFDRAKQLEGKLPPSMPSGGGTGSLVDCLGREGEPGPSKR